MEGKASGPSGSTPEPSVTRQLGKGLTSPRSVAGSWDGGKGSPSAASLSSVAADDGDAGCITSLGPRSQDGGSGITSLGPRSQDGGSGITSLGPRSQDGGSGVRSSYPPLRGAAEALSRQAFWRRSCTPVRLRHSSGSSSDAYAIVFPTEADRTRTGPGPGPDRDQTRTGPGMETGPGPCRTRLEAAGSLDQTGTSWSGGMLGMVTAAVVHKS